MTIRYNSLFLHPPFRPKPHRRPGQRKPPPAEDAFCSYNVLIRVSSVFWRRRRSGSGLGISPAKGQGPRRRPLFRLFRISQRNPLQRGKCRSEVEAMGVIRSAARTAFRRCAAGAAPTPPGARKARRPPLLKKGRNSATASGQALLDAPPAGSYVPPLRTGAEAGPTHRPFVALGAHSSAGRATDF